MVKRTSTKRRQKIMSNEKRSFASSKRKVACTMNWFLQVKQLIECIYNLDLV